MKMQIVDLYGFGFTSHLSENLWNIAHFALLYYASSFQPSRFLIFRQEKSLGLNIADVERKIASLFCILIRSVFPFFYVHRELRFYRSFRISVLSQEILHCAKYNFSRINKVPWLPASCNLQLPLNSTE